MKRSRAAIGIAATTTLACTALLASAPAVAKPTISDPIISGLATPLQMDVDTSKAIPRIVVGETFAGMLTLVKGDGTKKVLHTEDGAEVAGVAFTGKRIAFLTTSMDPGNPGSFLKVRKADGSVKTVADLRDFEVEQNPDGDATYGILGLDQECEDQLPPAEEAPLRPYSGLVDSHPYAVAVDPEGGWYVAEAAGNTILHVSPQGAVEVVTTFAPLLVEITADAAEANGLPECTIGRDYATEAVPTDVEVNRDGWLIASLLPGGPEDPSFGARGEVVQVKPATGKVKTIASGFVAASNVALSGGKIYVSELFGGQISKINQDAEVTKFVNASMPAALEWSEGQLFASIDALDEEQGGSLVAITP